MGASDLIRLGTAEIDLWSAVSYCVRNCQEQLRFFCFFSERLAFCRVLRARQCVPISLLISLVGIEYFELELFSASDFSDLFALWIKKCFLSRNATEIQPGEKHE